MLATPISLYLEPGQKVTLEPVSWQEFEVILAKLGEHRSSRIAYANQILEIMAPLPEHERSKVLIADLVKAILKAQRRRWEPLGSSTFKRAGMAVGIEPDDCFYIQNYRAVIGKDRLDLSVDPPPDLAIETDVTSNTKIAAYRALEVPELWVFAKGILKINVFQAGEYIESEMSPTFPDLAISQIIPQLIKRAKTVGVSQTLEEFETFLRNDR